MTILTRELRFDPIRNRWVIISTERARRPSDYLASENGLNIDEVPIVSCPFCEGSESKTPPEIFAIREPGSAPNSPGWKVRVVPNKYPALHVEDHAHRYATGMFDVVSGAGAHEVIIESPNHES
jgi:UDPglucose--hexose-1-phosphate uridylyltransferase